MEDIDYIQAMIKIDPGCPKIIAPRKYGEWDQERQFSYWYKLACSSNHALKDMQKERNDLYGEVANRDAKIASLEENLTINKAIVTDVINESNEAKDNYIAEITELRAKVIALQGQLNDIS